MTGRTAGWFTSRWAARIILGFGVLARLTQYLLDRSLWLDEALLSLNITQRPVRSLLAWKIHEK